MSLKIRQLDLHQIWLQTRLPFRYGIATMTRVPQLFVRLWVDLDGRHEAVGLAADLLPPKWFTKVLEASTEDELEAMLRVIRHSLDLAEGLQAPTAFDAWRLLSGAQTEWARSAGIPLLLANFGTSLVERALIEALCRAEGRSFAELLRANYFGIQLGALHPALKGATPADYLPEKPLPRITVRQTIGLGDALVDNEIAPSALVMDGLPQSLAASIRRYGLRQFKIKISGDTGADIERLARIAAVLQREAPADFALSLDGNEQFRWPADFRQYWKALASEFHLQALLRHLLFMEQPLHRDAALRPFVGSVFLNWPDRPPLIIDESDAAVESLPTALRLGYAGTSHKNCKGVFKSVINACLLRRRRGSTVLSGEDLCNAGPVALPQDLAAMAALGIASVERNGHHYFAGLSQFPEAVRQQMLQYHGDLFQASAAGWPTLRITNGELELGSVNRAPFGVACLVDVDQFEPVPRN